MALEEEFKDDRELDAGIDESIRATLKDIQSRAPEEAEPAEPVSAEPAVEAETPVVERARGKDGKFIEAEKASPTSAVTAKADTQEPVAAAVTDPVAAETALVTTTGQPIDINRAPASWKPAAKAAWGALPEAVRSEIYRREGNYLHDQHGIRANADFGQNIKTTLEPYRMLIEAEGGTPEKAIADTMRTAALFRVGTPQQKMAALYQIDKQFNCGFEAEFNRLVQEGIAKATGQPGAQPAQSPQPMTDPRVDKLLESMQAQERQRAQEAERMASQATQEFFTANDDKGQPLYPFIANVQDDMIPRVAVIRKANPSMQHNDVLKRAYDEAVWANPETRQVLMAQQQAQASQPAETLRKVEQAKRASAVNVPKRGALPATGPAKSIDETIRETGQALGMF